MLPHGSIQAKLLSVAENSIKINGHDTFEATFDYNLIARSYRTCVVCAFLGDQMLTMQVSSHPADFPKVCKAFHGTLFSPQWQKSR